MLTTVHYHAVGVGGVVGDATKLDLAGWDRDIRINMTSMVHMCRHAIPEMRKAGRGAIVNMSSVSGMLGGNPSLLYATTKGAIIQMTRAMAVHHGMEGIRVNCVAPGMVYTPMVRTRGGGMTEEMRRARIEQGLLGTEGTGWDVGYGEIYMSNLWPNLLTKTREATLFLCSKEARWITGILMPVDAGVSQFSAEDSKYMLTHSRYQLGVPTGRR